MLPLLVLLMLLRGGALAVSVVTDIDSGYSQVSGFFAWSTPSSYPAVVGVDGGGRYESVAMLVCSQPKSYTAGRFQPGMYMARVWVGLNGGSAVGTAIGTGGVVGFVYAGFPSMRNVDASLGPYQFDLHSTSSLFPLGFQFVPDSSPSYLTLNNTVVAGDPPRVLPNAVLVVGPYDTGYPPFVNTVYLEAPVFVEFKNITGKACLAIQTLVRWPTNVDPSLSSRRFVYWTLSRLR